jgi:hypothetical protein
MPCAFALQEKKQRQERRQKKIVVIQSHRIEESKSKIHRERKKYNNSYGSVGLVLVSCKTNTQGRDVM